MSLRGKKPEPTEERLKIFLYGPAGGGKTLAALQFPDAYIIDCEKGTTRYSKLINEKKSEVVRTTDASIIEEEIESLINEKHRFTTLIIDPITIYWQAIQDIWNEKFIQAQVKLRKENLLEDFGFRYWDKVKKQYKRTITRLIDLDMNVIVTAHQKDKWGSGQSVVGITSDSGKKDEHTFDFVFRILKRGDKYIAITDKQRILPGDNKFPDEFNWNYKNLIKFYDKSIIEKPTIYTIKFDKSNIQENKEKTIMKKSEISPASKTLLELETTANKNQKSQKQDLPWEKENDTQVEDEKNITFEATGEVNQKKESSESNKSQETVKLNFLFKNLKKELISEKDFVNFITNVILWENINSLNDLTLEHLNILLENWKEKIIPKYRKAKKQPITKEEKSQKETNKKNIEKKEKTPLDLLQKKLKENNIFHKDFRRFIREIVGWKNIKFISNLSDKQINTLLNSWDEKVFPKYRNFISAEEEKDPVVGALIISNKESNNEQTENYVLEPNKSIRIDQMIKIKNFLSKENISEKEFLESFAITEWNEITQEGANNIIDNFDAVIAELKS